MKFNFFEEELVLFEEEEFVLFEEEELVLFEEEELVLFEEEELDLFEEEEELSFALVALFVFCCDRLKPLPFQTNVPWVVLEPL